jgi:hypothetical protein
VAFIVRKEAAPEVVEDVVEPGPGPGERALEASRP